MTAQKVLVIDDEESICWGLAKIVEDLGHVAETFSNAEDALRSPNSEQLSAMLLDVRLPGMSGLEALNALMERFDGVPVIVMTAYGDLTTAVEAIRGGAFEYVVKPFDSQKMKRTIERAVAASRCAEHAPITAIEGMIGQDAAMQTVFTRIAFAADSTAGVLIRGESGTGKELAARAVHQYSRRAPGPFVPVHVASLSSSLAESEMFGYVQGAFTGADADRDGLLKKAHGGTLFLDEVGDIPVELQIKLLRALEYGEFLPVGSDAPIRSDFRVVSATHRDLQHDMISGAFRQDLFYRLSAFIIEIPPLRDRGQDALLLAEQFAAHFSDGKARILSDEVQAELLARSWYGNVRELRNAMEHATVVSRGGTIEACHLPDPLILENQRGNGGNLSEQLQQWIRDRIAAGANAAQVQETLLQMSEPTLLRETLLRHRGNYSAAAKDLGVHRTTLRRKVEELGLDDV